MAARLGIVNILDERRVTVQQIVWTCDPELWLFITCGALPVPYFHHIWSSYDFLQMLWHIYLLNIMWPRDLALCPFDLMLDKGNLSSAFHSRDGAGTERRNRRVQSVKRSSETGTYKFEKVIKVCWYRLQPVDNTERDISSWSSLRPMIFLFFQLSYRRLLWLLCFVAVVGRHSWWARDSDSQRVFRVTWMMTLNAVGRPHSFDTSAAEHVTTVVGDSATGQIDDNHKVCVCVCKYVCMNEWCTQCKSIRVDVTIPDIFSGLRLVAIHIELMCIRVRIHILLHNEMWHNLPTVAFLSVALIIIIIIIITNLLGRHSAIAQ